jgi:hypothetical protein
MARPARGTFELRLDASELRSVSRKVGRGVDELRREVGDRYVDTIRSKIRSRTGALARSWGHRVDGTDVVVSTKGLPYGAASVKGAMIRAKKKFLVFPTAGGTVFAKAVRLTPGHYVGSPGPDGYLEAAELEFGAVTEQAFDASFGKLGEL